ncbi:MAG: DNA primase, partial [Gammaproteobacteria bacterium]
MAGRIPHGFIDDLLARADIVDVIDRRVPLKKAGTEYKACCPFHGEKTPSFTVSPAKQFYHCFGCGAHGTAIGFLMEYESLSFPEAVEELASAVGVEVPREEGERGDDLSHLYRLLTDTEAFFRAQLRGPGGKAAVDYLRGRGLSGDIAARFSLGYAPAGFDNLKRHFRGKASEADLLAAGLVSSKEDNGHVYDKFRDRVMFPIRDRRGRVVGFGGRVMAADGGPKYLNSPETPVFHKGNELYGLYEALKDGARPDFLIVVEGYMDVVALAQFGIHNAVASLGTAATSQQVRRLFKTVPRVVFCFDGDRAGRQAAWRALENALPVLGPGHEARFAFLPEGEDPDSLVREEGDEAFLERLDQARPMLEYLFDTLEDGLDLGTVEGKAALTERVRPLLEKVSDGVLRDLLDERVAKRVELDPKRLAQRLPPAPKPIRPVQGSGGSVDPSRSPVRQAIALVLEQPGLSRRV